jgi:L-asparaginase II
MRTDAPKNPEKKLYENRCSGKKKLYENRCSEKTPEKNYMRTDDPIKKSSINSTNIQ